MLEAKHKIQNSLSLAALVILFVKENLNIVTYILSSDSRPKINSIYLYNICYIQFLCSWFLQQTHFPFPQVCVWPLCDHFLRKKGVIRREQVDFFPLLFLSWQPSICLALDLWSLHFHLFMLIHYSHVQKHTVHTHTLWVCSEHRLLPSSEV